MSETTTLPPDLEATVERLLRLPEEQRLAISDRLWTSVPLEPSLLDECRQRDEELVSAPEQGLPIHDALAAVRSALAETRRSSSTGGG